MWFPSLRGFIERRLLINYRLDPEVLQRCLPAPFRPQIVHGYGLAGICLIRMGRLGPRFLPFPLLGTSENAALRFAVVWEHEGQEHHGVYIPARYTTSRLAALAGARVFPGRHYRAPFRVEETAEHFHVELDHPQLRLSVAARLSDTFTGSRVFATLQEASAFFRSGAEGYSEARRPGKFDGVELRIPAWDVSALAVEKLACSYFEDALRFPPGTAEFDNALLMRGLRNEFYNLRSFCCLAPAEQPAQRVAIAGALTRVSPGVPGAGTPAVPGAGTPVVPGVVTPGY
jgi:hypothetical protein